MGSSNPGNGTQSEKPFDGRSDIALTRQPPCPTMADIVYRSLAMRLLRERDRRLKTGIPRSTWYALMANGKAPKPIKIGERSVAWLEDDLEQWIEALDGHVQPAAAAPDGHRR